MSVVIETTIGDITIDLFTDERPIACLNFLKLCKLKYYNFNLFHTIEQGFIAQTGDPSGKGDGLSASSIWGLIEGPHKRLFEAESLPKIYHSSAGLISLVNTGKNLVGSQFFFTLGSNLTSLDGIHCVIGEVVEGHDILRKLNEAIVDEVFRPYQDIRITHTVVLDDPFLDPRGFQLPSRSPSPTPERLKNGRIAADEDIDDTDGKTMQEIQEMLAEREAKARATILEIVGDIPDADVAPPENVLFVCKLNPVTSDDDLEIIFSRFGKVKGCEVIRDKKSGDSLQYAFVEFEEQKACEAAYFKMDNVLIDDRRIHVDFSQSVAKVKWLGKGRGVKGSEFRLNFNDLRDNKKKTGYRKTYSTDHREQMTSEERRKNREKRHREQEKREKEVNTFKRSGSRSRSRYNEFQGSKQSIYEDRRCEKSKYPEQKSYSHNKTQEKYRRKVERNQSVEKDNSKRRRLSSKERSPCSKRQSRDKRYSSENFAESHKVIHEKPRSKSTKKSTKKKRRESSSSDSSVDSESTISNSDSSNYTSSSKQKQYKSQSKSKKSKRKKSKTHSKKLK